MGKYAFVQGSQRNRCPCTLQACHEELQLWAALLPTAVERARQTYEHANGCAYSVPSDDSPTICSCGMGKDLPPALLASMRSVKAMSGGAAVTTLVYRAALPPLYARPEVSAAKGSVSGGGAGSGVRCAKCSKRGSCMRCVRCRKVTYCSKECQRQDWKNHKPMCAPKAGSEKP